MTMTIKSSSDQGWAKHEEGTVKIEITDGTYAGAAHGFVEKGDVLEVSRIEAHQLKAAGKAVDFVEKVEAVEAAESEDAALDAEDDAAWAKHHAEFEAALEACKTKAELVAFGKDRFGLDLSERSSRQELVDQLVAAQVEADEAHDPEEETV